MLEALKMSRETFLGYMSSGTEIFSVLLALIYLVFSRKKHRSQILMGLNGGGLMIILLFPGVFLLLGRILKTADVSDSFMVIPAALIAAYTGVLLLDREQRFVKKALTVGMWIFLLLAGVSIPWKYSLQNIRLADNSMKISDETFEVAAVVGSEYTMLPWKLAAGILEYDSGANILPMETGLEEAGTETVFKEAEAYGCEYVVLQQDLEDEILQGDYEYEVCSEVQQYIICRRKQ